MTNDTRDSTEGPVEALLQRIFDYHDAGVRTGVGMQDTKYAKEHPQDSIEWAHKSDAMYAGIKDALDTLLQAAQEEAEAKIAAAEMECAVARLALRAMMDATDAHRTDGKNTPKHLEAARTQASAVLASTPAE